MSERHFQREGPKSVNSLAQRCSPNSPISALGGGGGRLGSDIFEVLKLTSHVISILELSTFGKVHSFEYLSHIVSVLKVTQVVELVAQSECV